MWDSLYLVCLPDALIFYRQYALKTLNVWLFIVYALILNASFLEVYLSDSLFAPSWAMSWDIVSSRKWAQ